MQTTSMQILKNNKTKNLKGGFNMFKTMNKRIKNEKGLTLIELLAVIVILAIVAAIAVPAIGNIINNSEIKAVKADALNVLNAANIYVTDNSQVTSIAYATTGTYTINAGALTAGTDVDDFKDYIQSLGELKNVAFTITKTGGKLSITTDAKLDAGGKKIKFNAATVDDINADTADTDNTAKGADDPGNEVDITNS